MLFHWRNSFVMNSLELLLFHGADSTKRLPDYHLEIAGFVVLFARFYQFVE